MCFLFILASTISSTINVEYNEKDGRQYIKVEWPDATKSFTFKVLRSKNNEPFQSISTMDLESGEEVKVLNLYPTQGTNIELFDSNKNKLKATEKSAGLKVYMEGGYYGSVSSPKIDAYGAQKIDGVMKQLIKVDQYPISEFKKNHSLIWGYDVVMIGSYDDFPSYKKYVNGRETRPNLLTNDDIANLTHYLDCNYGLLIGHDGISVVDGNDVGLGIFAKRLGIKTGYMPTFSSVKRDVEGFYKYMSRTVVVVKEGRLTEYPWSLGKVREFNFTIPVSHTACQFASLDIWFEFTNGWEEQNGQKTLTAEQTKQYGNGVFYLTTNNNLAFIQTGHEDGSSTVDEMKILANTLYYLKQRSQKGYVNDFDVYDTNNPEKPVVSKETVNKKVVVNVHGKDLGTKYIYQVYGFDNYMNQEYSSKNITAETIAGIKGFHYILDTNPTCTQKELLTQFVPIIQQNPAAIPLEEADDDFHFVDNTKKIVEGDAVIEIPFELGDETKHLHILSVDQRDQKSEIVNLEISFPTKPPTEPIKPPTEPIKPPTEPIKPPTEPIKPPTEPVKPPTEPVKPPTEPVKPPTEPTKEPITEPSKGPLPITQTQEPAASNVNGDGADSKSETGGNSGGSKTGTIIGAVVGAVAGAAAVAGVVAGLTKLLAPVPIVPFNGSEEEEEEEDFLENLGDLFDDPSIVPPYEDSMELADSYMNDIRQPLNQEP